MFRFFIKKKKSQPNSPFRCGRADHSGSADGRLRGRRGALSPWQPDGGQHHLGHRRRRRAAGNNPEKVFYENTQQDNEGQSWKTTPWAVTGVCAFADGGVCPAAHQRRRHQGLARHSEDVRPPELEGGAGRRHDLRSARGVFVSLRWVRLKASPAPPRPLPSTLGVFSSDLLGGRLEAAEDAQLKSQACLCYICAGNVEKLVSCGTRAQAGHSPLSLQVCVRLMGGVFLTASSSSSSDFVFHGRFT